MTTAQRREEILALLNQADAPIAAKDLAARFGVSRQVIGAGPCRDPGIPAQYHLHQPRLYPAAAGNRRLREFKVRHTPEQAGQELNLIVDHGGR